MAVPPEVIDEIRSRIDIIRVIGDVVPLRKSGRNFMGRCPFHEEKTPSFSVSADKQLYHCFGCGEGGTVFNFLMKYHHLNFPETLERLAPLAGVDLSRFREESQAIGRRKEERRRLVRALTYARDFYAKTLLESDQAEKARAYAKRRGISIEQARDLQLGYAPAGWQSLTDLFRRHDFPLEDGVKAGLLARGRGEEKCYDLFRDRLLFPITDPKGEPVGFGGRILDEGNPKYLNSPQTAIFDKGRLLYGLHNAEESIRSGHKAILVEGYMDQVALRLAGVTNAVATLGTAFTDAHAQLLRKYADEVIVVFDGDAAGLQAARRSMRPLLGRGLRARVVRLPEGHDPDTFVREHGRDDFLKRVSDAPSVLEFFVSEFYEGQGEVHRKAEAISELADAIRSAETVFLREAILDEAVKRTGLPKDVLRGEREPVFRSRPMKAPSPASPERASVVPELMMLLRISAEIPDVRRRFLATDALEANSDPAFADPARRWLEELDGEAGDFSAAKAVDRWTDETTKPLIARAFIETPMPSTGQWERVWNDCFRKLRGRERQRLLQAMNAAYERGDDADGLKLGRRIEELKKQDQRNAGGANER